MLDETNALLDEIYELSDTELQWRQISSRLLEIRSHISTKEFQIEEFRLRIFLHSIAPNIRHLCHKRKVGNQKFSQLLLLLGILFNYQSGEHPASTLNDLENIVESMKMSSGWWKTEFALDLMQVINLEWLPILRDNR
jgi:hypothetical protein